MQLAAYLLKNPNQSGEYEEKKTNEK